MESLPLKYRPEKFEDLIGQEINVRYLSTLIKRGQIGKNIILYGAFGSSKTTSCRIYARALNCLSIDSTGSPCNKCENCKAFYSNQFPDYLEVDGSSHGGKDQIKDLADIAKTPPLFGKYRIINIDECQGLSKQAWDALLKLIEEPPPFLVFIFTTTEINKVREAIQSRCQCLEVKLLSPQVSKEHLRKICQQEKIPFEELALELISFISSGHPRDLLKNLEQIYYLGDISIENVKSAFNLDHLKNLINYFTFLFDQNKYIDLTNLVEIWNSTPGEISIILKEFFVYFNYVYVSNVSLIVNPIFKLIPRKDFQNLFSLYKSLVESKSLEIETATASLFKEFTFKVDSKISLLILTHNLFMFIHKHNFNVKMFGSPVIDQALNTRIVNSSEAKRNGRKFVGNFIPIDSKPIQELVIVDPPKSDKIYPHTLLTKGFSPKEASSLSIAISRTPENDDSK